MTFIVRNNFFSEFKGATPSDIPRVILKISEIEGRLPLVTKDQPQGR